MAELEVYSPAYIKITNTSNVRKRFQPYKENFTFEVIEECKKEELDEKEKYWIKQYNSFLGFENCNGYNMTLGGQNNIPHKLTYKKVEEIHKQILAINIIFHK